MDSLSLCCGADSAKWVVLKNSITLWSKWVLTFLVQVIVGGGLPDAGHSRVTLEPFLTSTKPPEVTWRILGGTETEKNVDHMSIYKSSKDQKVVRPVVKSC